MIEPRFRVHDACFDVFEDSHEFIWNWRERWGASIHNFEDSGCGCCVHILSFVSSEVAILELEAHFGDRVKRQAMR